MKESFYKKWYVLTHVVLLLFLGFSFFVIYRLTEKDAINTNKITELKKSQENQTMAKINSTVSMFTSRFDDELFDKAVNFYIDKDKVVSNFGDTVELGGGYLTIKKPSFDEKRMLATESDFENVVVIPIEFNNTTGDTIGFDSRDVFAYSGDDALSFDSVVSENLYEDGYTVVVEDGETATAGIIFGTNSKIKDIKVRYSSGLWK